MPHTIPHPARHTQRSRVETADCRPVPTSHATTCIRSAVHNASLSSWSIESRKQCIQQLYRILRILNTNTDRTGLNRGIVITRRRHAITHEHHFIGPYAKCLRQLAHGIAYRCRIR